MLRGNAKGCWLKKGVTASGAERVELNEFQDEGCCDGVAGSTGVEYDAVEVVGVEDRRPNIGPVFDTTRGQLPTRPAGLLRTVGRMSSSGLYALARFRLLDEKRGQRCG